MSRESSHNPFLSSLLLGTGGPEPGLWTFGSDTVQVESLVGLPSGRSVYAVDINAAGDLLAIGDRLGGIEVRSWLQAADQGRLSDVASLNQGAPILSVCLLDGRRLAVADVAGRCLLWQLSDPMAPPTYLKVDGAVICSLVRLGQGQMLGLSADGRLLLWSMPDGGLIGTIPGPRPPRQLSLVRLCPWPALGAVVYPAADGSLMACPFDEPSPKGRPAHDGAFYACIAVGDQLYSIGSHDGRLKVWQADGRKPIAEYAVTPGIVSGQIVPDDSGRLLLVDRRGTAGTYGIGSGSVGLLRRLGGTGHRTVFGPGPEGRELLARHRRMDECEQLHANILRQVEAGQSEGIEDLHCRLVDLGAEDISLALRVRQAVQEGNIVAEIHARRHLATVMPQQGPASLRRYADILARTWQLAEARAVYSRLPDDQGHGAMLDRLAEAIEIMSGDNWIVKTDMPVEALIGAATAMDRPFEGRWLLGTAEPIALARDGVSAERLVAEYQEVNAQDEPSDLPPGRVETLWWLSDNSARETETVVFGDRAGGTCADLTYAIEIRPDGPQAILIPSVLFDAGPRRPDEPAGLRNRRLLDCHERITLGRSIEVWPSALRSTVCSAIRQLRSRARWHQVPE